MQRRWAVVEEKLRLSVPGGEGCGAPLEGQKDVRKFGGLDEGAMVKPLTATS